MNLQDIVKICCILHSYSIFAIKDNLPHTEEHKFENEAEKGFDENGYIIFCPCMGRFGNKVEHLLGALAFAKNIDRTLVLPHWATNKGYIPFDDWFRVEVVAEYHRVILVADFMDFVAPRIWPVGKRVGMCYTVWSRKDSEAVCEMKVGSPFGPFWDYLGVNFDQTIFYTLTYDKEDSDLWKQEYPAIKYPVLALRGAPASFPVRKEHRNIHEYLWWSKNLMMEASEFMASLFGKEKYIALHLRNGPDWQRACEYAVGMQGNFMASVQCLGYNYKGSITQDLCLPGVPEITRKARQAVLKANVTVLYIAADHFTYQSELEVSLSDLRVTVVHGDPDIPQIDLIVMAQAEILVANCVSSFSAFAVREREFVTKKPTVFFGIEFEN